MTTISCKKHKATKCYTCNDCDLWIREGENYYRLFGYAEPGDSPYEIMLCVTCRSRNILQLSINEILQQRHEHIERYAAAFLKEVGSEEASKYSLVEVHEDNKIRWYFEKR